VTESSSTPGGNGPAIDSSMPHSARVWNYWLGGKDFYPVDRMVGDQVMQMFPDISQLARADRAFLDIGTGLPTANNTHQVAQAIAPSSRIVYVDNDPLVLVHARALLTSTPEGACDYIDADMRDTSTILAEAARTLDFSRPVALMMLGIVGQVPDSDQPGLIIRQLMEPMPSGSYLALSDGTNTSESFTTAVEAYNQSSANTYHPRSPAALTGFFDGLKLVSPGVVELNKWRPDATLFPDAGEVPGMGGVGRKP